MVYFLFILLSLSQPCTNCFFPFFNQNHCFHFDFMGNLHWIGRNLNVAIQLESWITIIINNKMNTSPASDSTSNKHLVNIIFGFYFDKFEWICISFFLRIENINHMKSYGIWASVEILYYLKKEENEKRITRKYADFNLKTEVNSTVINAPYILLLMTIRPKGYTIRSIFDNSHRSMNIEHWAFTMERGMEKKT